MNSVNSFSARLGLGRNSFCLSLLAIPHYFNRPAQHGDTLLNSVTSCAHRQSHSITLTHNSTKTLTPWLLWAQSALLTRAFFIFFCLWEMRLPRPPDTQNWVYHTHTHTHTHTLSLSLTHSPTTEYITHTHTHTNTHLASPVKCNLIRWAAHVKYSHTHVKDKEIQARNCGCVWMHFENNMHWIL